MGGFMKKITLKVTGYDTKKKIVSVGDEIAFEISEESDEVERLQRIEKAAKGYIDWVEKRCDIRAPRELLALRDALRGKS
jgi:hypothetical protein